MAWPSFPSYILEFAASRSPIECRQMHGEAWTEGWMDSLRRSSLLGTGTHLFGSLQVRPNPVYLPATLQSAFVIVVNKLAAMEML